jgi:4-hydroxy-L-threonine phosphate dehydrogenase PdxA
MSLRDVALTIGDPNSSRHEIAVKAVAFCAGADDSSSTVLAGEHVIGFYSDRFASGHRPVPHDSGSSERRALRYLAVNALSEQAFEPGLRNADGGRATVVYVGAALQTMAEGHAESIVGIEGPVDADLRRGQNGFDALVAMCRDQGHIPVKLRCIRRVAGANEFKESPVP